MSPTPLIRSAPLLLLLSLSGCVTRYVTLPERHSERITTQRIDSVHRIDSVFVYDSVFIRQWLRGDTVYLSETEHRSGKETLRATAQQQRSDSSVQRNDSTTAPPPNVQPSLAPAGGGLGATFESLRSLLWVLCLLVALIGGLLLALRLLPKR